MIKTRQFERYSSNLCYFKHHENVKDVMPDKIYTLNNVISVLSLEIGNAHNLMREQW